MPNPDVGLTSARHLPARTVEKQIAELEQRITELISGFEERFAKLEAQLKR